MTYLFIDIRQSDEVLAKRFQPQEDYKVYNIPMNMIRFKTQTIINHLQYVDEIYLVCRTGKRSEFIKNKYFQQYPKIKVNTNLQMQHLNPGNQIVKFDNGNLNVKVIGDNNWNLYNMTRIVQVILGSMVFLLGGLSLYLLSAKSIKQKIPLIILVLFGLFALGSGLTGSCVMSKVFMNSLN